MTGPVLELAAGDEPPARGRRSRRRRRVPALVAVLLALLLLGGVLAAGAYVAGRALDGFSLGGSDAEDFSGEGEGEVTVTVAPGQTAGDIGAVLADAGVVASRQAFFEVALADTRSQTIQPGTYRMALRMSAAAALERLLDPTSRVVARVTVREGWTVVTALPAIAQASGIPLAELQAAAEDPAAIGLPDYAEGELEGFLFPATYDLEPGATAAEVLGMMVKRFTVAAEGLRLESRAQELGLTPREAVTVASLVEAETPKDDERGKVARVVYNRLDDDDRKLRFDSTVKYVYELQGEKKTRLFQRDLEIDSPYNTYQNAGLPPGPIGNPGEAALEAALAPTPGPWKYFVVIDKEGNSAFTDDFEEHQNNVQRYQREVLGND